VRTLKILALVTLAVLVAHCTRAPAPGPVAGIRTDAPGEVTGIHLLSYTTDARLVELGKVIPRVNEIVFPLIDEIVEAFGADGIHVGMDEIFLLGSDESPSTRGKDPAELFARVVNEFHDHFAKEKGLEMFMWGDRLIDGEVLPYGSWSASLNGTARAVDMIPNDIVICDWHYAPQEEYTSIPMFLEKGFRVLPSSWRDLDGVDALIKYSYRIPDPRMMGHLFTTWRRLEPDSLVSFAPMVAGIETIATPPSPKYPTRDSVATLVNGALGSSSYGDGQWVGLEKDDLVAQLDYVHISCL